MEQRNVEHLFRLNANTATTNRRMCANLQASRTMGRALVRGAAGTVMHPYRGAQSDGAAGFAHVSSSM
jgi:hypothetical protein